MTDQKNFKNTLLLIRLQETTAQTVWMLRRIANRSHGLKENDMGRLVLAFVVHRIIYAAPYGILGASEHQKLDALLIKTYKQALTHPKSSFTVRLMALDLHNTIQKFIEATYNGGESKTRTSTTGRETLGKLGYTARRTAQKTPWTSHLT